MGCGATRSSSRSRGLHASSIRKMADEIITQGANKLLRRRRPAEIVALGYVTMMGPKKDQFR
jgi:hypothetical protein